MINLVNLIGRINFMNPECNTLEIKYTKTLYENDVKVGTEEVYIPVIVNDSMMKRTKRYCNINDVISIKGYLKNRDGRLMVIAEKITVLSFTHGTNRKGGDDNEVS